MYIEKKKIGNKVYNYLKISVRAGDKVKTKTVAYLGRAPMTINQIKEKIAEIPKSDIQAAKEAIREELEPTYKFLTEAQLDEIGKIRKDFTKKLKILDKQLIDDMFRDFKTHYVYNTNAIEGNTLTLQETDLLLNENRSPEGKDLREIYDHINEKETFDYILNGNPGITINSIINIHSRLLKNIDNRTGNFRTHNVRVFGADFDTTDAKYVLTDMKILLRWYGRNKNKLHPIALAAIFHEKFERIHPFYDGNGRTGRMLMNVILLENKLPPLIIKNDTRKEYYLALSEGHKAGLTKVQKGHKSIVTLCYNRLVGTYKEIFSKWG